MQMGLFSSSYTFEALVVCHIVSSTTLTYPVDIDGHSYRGIMSSTFPLAKQPFGGHLGVEHLCLLLVLFALFAVLYTTISASNRKDTSKVWSAATNFAKFFYASFLKPHSKDRTHVGQQAALESFYRAQVRRIESCLWHPKHIKLTSMLPLCQMYMSSIPMGPFFPFQKSIAASLVIALSLCRDKESSLGLANPFLSKADVYDATRTLLLQGREDMLSLAAAQLKHQAMTGHFTKAKPVWVDIGGGTGYNIEAMQAYVDVPTFFGKVYLVDLSPSLLDIARKRFERLGWDVETVCQDARTFRLPQDAQEGMSSTVTQNFHDASEPQQNLPSAKASLVTMSYSLSMIPDYYSVIDSLPSLLSADGILGVVDFYVQSIVEIGGRTYTGGSFNRHVTWLGRVFWRAWFDVDRVGLEGARRDYLEYRFGTLKTVDERNYLLGGIPYYSELCLHLLIPQL